MPATCSSCRRTFTKISFLLAHIRIIHANNPGFKIACSANGCCRNFTSFKAFRNHVYSFHRSANDFSWGEEESTAGVISDDADNLDLDDSPVDDIDDADPSEADMQRAAAMTILKIREQHRLPQGVMSGIIFEVQSLYDVALSVLKHRVDATLSGAGVSSDVVQEATQHLDEHSVFKGLESNHRLTQYCKEHFHLVVCTM